MLERYADRRAVIFELIHWYRRELARCAAHGIPAGWWAYGQFADGAPITPAQRHRYREQPDLIKQFPNPFLSGQDSYQEWFARAERAYASQKLETR